MTATTTGERIDDLMVVQAANRRETYAERHYEMACTEFVTRHVLGPAKHCAHYKDLARLRADHLETRLAARELRTHFTGQDQP